MKIKCMRVDGTNAVYFTVGKEYKISSNVLVSNKGIEFGEWAKEEGDTAIEKINNWFRSCGVHFEQCLDEGFKANDLKDGMWVTCRSGERMVYLNDTFYLGENGDLYYSSNIYNYNFEDGKIKHKSYNCIDIVKVEQDGKVIWEEKEEKGKFYLNDFRGTEELIYNPTFNISMKQPLTHEETLWFIEKNALSLRDMLEWFTTKTWEKVEG